MFDFSIVTVDDTVGIGDFHISYLLSVNCYFWLVISDLRQFHSKIILSETYFLELIVTHAAQISADFCNGIQPEPDDNSRAWNAFSVLANIQERQFLFKISYHYNDWHFLTVWALGNNSGDS